MVVVVWSCLHVREVVVGAERTLHHHRGADVGGRHGEDGDDEPLGTSPLGVQAQELDRLVCQTAEHLCVCHVVQ